MSNKKLSPDVADLSPHTTDGVQINKQISPTEAATILLNAMTEYLGTETKARAFLDDIPEAANIIALFPKRKQGRPADPIQQRKDAALLDVYQWEKEKGKLVKEIVYYLHAEHKLGQSESSLKKKLERLLEKKK